MHDIASPQHHQHATPRLDPTRRIVSHHPHASYPTYAGAWRSTPLRRDPDSPGLRHHITAAGIHGRHPYVTRRRCIRDPPVPPRFGYTDRASCAQRRSRRRCRHVPGVCTQAAAYSEAVRGCGGLDGRMGGCRVRSAGAGGSHMGGLDGLAGCGLVSG
jgi:hypothetical protein